MTKTTYTALTPIEHDQVLYGEGDEISLNEAAAEPLLALKAIAAPAKPVARTRAPRAPKAPGAPDSPGTGDGDGDDTGGDGAPAP